MNHFDPNAPGNPEKLFGFPYSMEEADLVLIPVPWEVTASYGNGAANGPQAIQEASFQIDYSIPGIKEPWQLATAMDVIDPGWLAKGRELRKKAREYIHWIENDKQGTSDYFFSILNEINQSSQALNQWVYDEASRYLNKGKIVGIIGGDHSTPIGLINALGKIHPDFGILQIDAHMDLRKTYEGFENSHASIMENALKNKAISKLVQVGVRDYCEEEVHYVKASGRRVITHFDQVLKERSFRGESLKSIYREVISPLPDKVYISFDIDGLDPKLCPNTGTPVPGGLDFQEAVYLVYLLVRSGREIIGFDLSEVSPGTDQWDGNVGARMLYHLCSYTGISQGKLRFEK